jgi:hypothetical protein
MDLSEIEKFESTKVLKLSDAIRIGLPHIQDGPSHYQCAIACAFYAVYGRAPLPENCEFWSDAKAGDYFGVPFPIVNKFSTDHFNGRKTRTECADWLEAQGY